MRDGVHIRLTLTRGMKVTSGMDPRLNQYGSTLIVLAEWKPPVYSSDGIRLITASVRRNTPQCIDSKIHHNNLINNILAKIEANVAGVDDAVMLDIHGFVSETNATNIFLVKRGELLDAPRRQLPARHHAPRRDRPGARGRHSAGRSATISLSEMYSADEMFTTGTMGELAPVLEVDGRIIGAGEAGPLTRRMQAASPAAHCSTKASRSRSRTVHRPPRGGSAIPAGRRLPG